MVGDTQRSPVETLNDLQFALMTALHDSTGTGTGGIDWSFSIPDRDLDFLGVGETLTVVYDVTVSDGTTTSTKQVTVTATGAADAMIVNPDTATIGDTLFTDAGQIVATGNAIFDASDSPGDGSLSLSITAVDGHAANVGTSIAAAHGSLVVDVDGTYHYTANSALDQLQIGDSATDQFTITVTNGLGESHDTTLTFNMFGADDAPVITAANALGTLTEGRRPFGARQRWLRDRQFERLDRWRGRGRPVVAGTVEYGNYSRAAWRWFPAAERRHGCRTALYR